MNTATHYELNNGVKVVRLSDRRYQLLVGTSVARLTIDVDRCEVVYILSVAKSRGIKLVEITRWHGAYYTSYPR